MDRSDHILFPTDLSPAADGVLAQAAFLAKSLGARLVLYSRGHPGLRIRRVGSRQGRGGLAARGRGRAPRAGAPRGGAARALRNRRAPRRSVGARAPPLKLSYRGLGEMAVGACYGPLIAAGAYLVQRGEITAEVVLPSLPLGLMVAAFLWINEFPDYSGDRATGKRNLVVRLGRRRASRAFVVLVVCAFASVALMPAAGAPSGVLLGLLGAPLGLRAGWRLMARHETTSAIVPAQAWTLGSFLLLAPAKAWACSCADADRLAGQGRIMVRIIRNRSTARSACG